MPSSTSSSDNAYPAVKTSFFDPEHVERPVPERSWRVIVLIAAIATAVLMIGWETYWRGKEYIAGDYKNTAALWTVQRNKATGDATVLIGSSRMLFDIDLDIWEEMTGVRPIQLSLEGTSPRIFLTDLANDEAFHGTVIVGLMAPLFFTTDGGLRAEVLKYRREESPSQRWDHQLSLFLERYFAFTDEQTRPKRQMTHAPLPLRDGMNPLFDPRKLEVMTADRNTEMWSRVVNDEVFREEARAQWEIALKLFAPPPNPDGSPPAPMPDVVIDGVIAEVQADIKKIRARGGDVAFARMPYGGAFTPAEDFGFPRERFWDRLLAKTETVGVTWHDHEELQGYELPEWSHLSASEAERFTRAFVPIFAKVMEEAEDPK